ncbi:fumarylacetoacetate hydrolase family protein [Robbsia sp. Bb-Pol-6]|uniref:Fumarylacetoacetate hydrolase family protein n=1 Tax=Robbsia betulipollinis TaxID=2981849 RepID=A0ABT3ZRN1_9BURK|nr:fumarylacetoacetate hydrolase family protein [Robbsia betulipollinis]MCY0389077.1 fumarylacetoacetate hydrolase family protein [Robbsia betulipollinis]
MKLATLKDGTRDGQLVVVSRDLHTAVIADAIAPTLQRVIEDWAFHAPQLRALYEALNTGRARRAFGFEPKDCMAPLPRAYRMIAHAAYATAGVDPARTGAAPMMLAARRGDALLGACDDVLVDEADAGLTCDVGLAAILGDLPPGSAPARAADRLHLLMLADIFAAPAGPGRDGGEPLRQYDRCAFSPVAVTPDEFGAAWQGVRLTARVDVQLNGRRVEPRGVEAEADRAADFAQLAAAIARTQGVAAGTIVVSATLRGVAGFEAGTEARAAADAAPVSPRGLETGDRIRVDSLDATGESVCGVIEHSIVPADDSV